jgi:adenylate kinase family enzyme
VLERVRLRGRLRAAWLRHLWTLEGEPGGKFGVTHAEADAVMDDRDAPDKEATWLAGHAGIAKTRARLVTLEANPARTPGAQLSALDQRFGLGPGGMDLLHGCLAHAVDPGIGRLYAYLQDHASRTYLTEDLAVRLFGHGRTVPWTADSGIFRWELIAQHEIGPGEPRALLLDPQIRDWVLGRHELDRLLVGMARLHAVRAPLRRWPIQPAVELLKETLGDERRRPARVVVRGVRGSGRRTFAAAVAAELGLHLLTVDADAVDDRVWPGTFLRAQRQAYLDVTALAWSGESLSRRAWRRDPQPFPVQFLILEPGQAVPPLDGAVEHAVEMPPLTAAERERLWREHAPVVATWPAGQLTAVAERYQATPGEIEAAARTGVRTPDAAASALRHAGRGRLGDLAQQLDCPFTWDDLVVGDPVRATLEDLVFEARTRVAFWEQPQPRRLFPQGRGLIALLAGDPGVGKTMAAQVIAAQLGPLDLYRIDLAAIVSKWVGETSKHIDLLLRRAADMNVVLLFDEADALYAKRTSDVRDAQDKYVAMDTAHLMVAIESYTGVVLLSTNLKNNIDPAFLRRVRYVVDVPRPDARQRLEIWRKVITGLAGAMRTHALDRDLQRLAVDVDATGSQIKYAALAATFAAARREGPLGLADLLRGLNRELAKEGRAVSAREQERLLGHVS